MPLWAAVIGIVLAGVAVWLVTVRLPHAPEVRRTRLTSFGPDLAVTASAISPDGKLASYANAGGVFVQQIETGETHPLAMPAASFTALSLSWFRDGARLLVGGFAAQADTPGLWIMQVMGSNPPVQLGDGLDAAVSPDGGRIAMSGGPCWSPPEAAKVMAPEIRLMRSDGEGLRTLVIGNVGETFGPVAWRDGGHLMWVRYRWNPQLRRNTGTIDGYDIASGKRSVMLSGSDFSGDVVSAGGRVIYAQLLGANPSSNYGGRLFGMDSTSRTTLITEFSEPVAGLGSAAGTLLMVRNAVVEHSVFVADLNAGAPNFENIHRLTLGLGREDFPRAWMPDSRAVVFDSNRNGAWELFRQNLGSVMDEPVVHSADDSFSPRLSPDGRWLLYIDRPKNWLASSPVSVVRMPLSGGPTELVLQAAGISEWGLHFACAGVPGGPCVLAQQQGNQIVFRTFDAMRGFVGRAGEIARIPADRAHPVSWTISPDGSRLAWARWEAERARLHVIPLAPGICLRAGARGERLLTPAFAQCPGGRQRMVPDLRMARELENLLCRRRWQLPGSGPRFCQARAGRISVVRWTPRRLLAAHLVEQRVVVPEFLIGLLVAPTPAAPRS